MAIKVDLEKTYDRTDWNFIRDTLEELGFKEYFINLIMNCVSTGEMRLIWNGSLTEKFTPSRGIRQGDPLSTYLFVLCIERLAHCIEKAVEVKAWNPIKLEKNGTPISHLFFADELVLFT